MGPPSPSPTTPARAIAAHPAPRTRLPRGIPIHSLEWLSEGVNTLYPFVRDIVDHEGYATPWFAYRIDRTPPTIDASGDLVAHATDGQPGTNPSITIDAKDGAASPPSAVRSGVKYLRLSYKTEGASSWTVVQDYVLPEVNFDSCERQVTWNIPSSALAGSSTIRIDAWDYLGHARTSTFPVVVYPTSARYGGSLDSQAEFQQFDEELSDVEEESDAATNSLFLGLTPSDRLAYYSWLDDFPGWEDDASAVAVTSGVGPLNECNVHLKKVTTFVPRKKLRWTVRNDCGALPVSQVGKSDLRLKGTPDVVARGTPCIAIPDVSCISTGTFRPKDSIARQYDLSFAVVSTSLQGDLVWVKAGDDPPDGFDAETERCIGYHTFVLNCTYSKTFTF